MKFYTKLWLAILFVFLFSNSYGQEDFDLFNPDRGKPPPPPAPKNQPPPRPFTPPAPPPKPPEPPPPPKAQPPQKDFTLRGTSRIGERRAAILQPPDGKPEFIQYLTDNKPTEITGYTDYTLLSVEGRKVTLKYPNESPCRTSDAQKKLTCSLDQKTATLELMTLNALPPQAPMMPPPPPPPQPTAMVPTPQPPQAVPAAPINPFAAALQQQQQQANQNLSPEEQKRRQEEQQRRAELYKNFKRQVIKDEDVPPGMRVVHTPFGDRLVPDTRQ